MRGCLTALVVLVVALAGPTAMAQETWYLVDFEPGPNWVEGRLFDTQQGAEAHRAYVEQLFAPGPGSHVRHAGRGLARRALSRANAGGPQGCR
ncbi:MAG: hypothetical protein CMD83_06185 [Gammaproteobacteria bacterium]|nr:hypothetical protein [Gammaproteobacteria bacterium]